MGNRVGSTPTTRTSSSQATYHLRRAFSFHCKAYRSLILPLLSSKPDPLRWAPAWGRPAGGCFCPRKNIGFDRPLQKSLETKWFQGISFLALQFMLRDRNIKQCRTSKNFAASFTLESRVTVNTNSAVLVLPPETLLVQAPEFPNTFLQP